MSLIRIAYLVTCFLIRCYKSAEFFVFKIFQPVVERRIKAVFATDVKLIGDGISEPDQQEIKKFLNNHENDKKKKLEIVVHNREFFLRMANTFVLGMAESYMDKQWDCNDLVELSFLGNKRKTFLQYHHPWNRFLNYMQLGYFNLQTQDKAWEVADEHYDLGNDLYESFLDPNMQYTCGYWANADNLNDAQINKMELIAQKLKLKPGMTVLDIGCGWGGLCKYLAKNHGVKCIGATISAEGVKYGQEVCKGLPVEFRLTDYRDLNETFDRIVSVGMFEHVGHHNYRTYFEVAHRCLADDGLFLLQTIGFNDTAIPRVDLFYSTLIFPNGCLPYCQDITKNIEHLFDLEDWHNFGQDYYKTLMAWNENFERNWPKISHKYGERFFRMWTFYFKIAAGGFLAGKTRLWQIVLSKNDNSNEQYQSVR